MIYFTHPYATKWPQDILYGPPGSRRLMAPEAHEWRCPVEFVPQTSAAAVKCGVPILVSGRLFSERKIGGIF